jgi:heat shock protein HtpX
MLSAPVDIRPRRSMAIFAILAILMVVVSYVFILALAAACVYLPLQLLTFNAGGFQILALFLFGIVIAATMLWSLVPRRDRFEAPGMPLFRQDQRRLFAELDDIAASLNERLPGEVYLIPDANAFVADRGGVMGFGSRRVMGLGLPLFSVLTVSQFRAVLAHEFAHYYGGDTSFGPWVYRTKMAIIRTFRNVGSLRTFTRVSILGAMYLAVATVLNAYFKLFLRAVNLVSRRQEYRADELACLVAGRQPLIDGLRAIHGAAMAWPFYWQSEVAPELWDGTLLAVSDGFARFMTAPQIREAVDKNLEKTLRRTRANPYDTHPPLGERISATEQMATRSAPEDTRPATALLDHLRTLELEFIKNRIADIKVDRLKYVTWDEVALRVKIPAWQKAVAAHAAALYGVTVELIPDQIPKLPEIGSRIPDPRGMLLTRELRTQRAGKVFAAALALALIENSWELTVQPGIFKLRHGTDELNPFAAVAALMAGKLSRDDWIRQCKALGICQLSLSASDRAATMRRSEAQPTLFDSGAAT